jgi:hypothetical protein
LVGGEESEETTFFKTIPTLDCKLQSERVSQKKSEEQDRRSSQKDFFLALFPTTNRHWLLQSNETIEACK